MFFRWDDRPGLSRKFDDHSNNSEMPKGITFRCKIEKTIKQKLDTFTIKFLEQGSQAVLSHVSHSSVSTLVQNRHRRIIRMLRHFVMIFQVAHYSSTFEIDVTNGKVVIQLFWTGPARMIFTIFTICPSCRTATTELSPRNPTRSKYRFAIRLNTHWNVMIKPSFWEVLQVSEQSHLLMPNPYP